MRHVAEVGQTAAMQALRSVCGDVFQASGRPVELYCVMEALPRLKQVQAELYALECGAPELFSDFCPLAVIAPVDSCSAVQFWPPARGAAAEPQPIVDQDLPPIMDGGDDTGGDFGALDMDPHIDGDMIISSRQVASRRTSNAGLSSSDEEPVPPRPRHVPRVGGGGVAIFSRVTRPRLSASAAAPTAPPPPPPPELPSDPRRRRTVTLTAPRVCRVQRWPRVLTANGAIRMSQTNGKAHSDFRAECSLHGCTRDRNGRENRPIGHLYAWLAAAGGLSEKEHKDFVPSLAARIAARDQFEMLGNTEDFFANECGGAGRGEPEVTWQPRRA